VNRFARHVLLRDRIWNEFLALLDKSIKFVFHYRTAVGVTNFTDFCVFKGGSRGNKYFTEICENEEKAGALISNKKG